MHHIYLHTLFIPLHRVCNFHESLVPYIFTGDELLDLVKCNRFIGPDRVSNLPDLIRVSRIVRQNHSQSVYELHLRGFQCGEQAKQPNLLKLDVPYKVKLPTDPRVHAF